MNRLRRATALLLACCLLAAVVSAACQTLEKPQTEDIVSDIPWTAPEEHTYRLLKDGEEIGRSTLSVEQDGDTFTLVQHSDDGEGNTDTSRVVVDSETLKPFTGRREIADPDRREAADTCYEYADGHQCEDVSYADCDSKQVVRIEEQVFDPPGESTPDIPRRAPLCVPANSYDNDTSLFIWRTIAFAKRYEVNYNSVLTGVRGNQLVRISVLDQVDNTPVGEREAWYVQIAGDGKNQYAWFSTDSEHVLLAYQNDDFTFELME